MSPDSNIFNPDFNRKEGESFCPIERISSYCGNINLNAPLLPPPLTDVDGEIEFFAPINDHCVPNILYGKYFVSTFGRVWDARLNKQVPMIPNGNRDNPYYRVKLAYADPTNPMGSFLSKDCFVHRLVLMTFRYFPGCEQMEANHLGPSINDHSINMLKYLAWVTPQQNRQFAYKNAIGTNQKPTYNAIFTADEVIKIATMIQNGLSDEQIAESFNLQSSEAIYRIRSRQSYAELTKDFIFENTVTQSGKLKTSTVHEICKRLERGDKIVDICSSLKVKRYIVNDIKAKRNYTEISNQYNIPEVNKMVETKLPEEIVHEICKMIVDGDSCQTITDHVLSKGFDVKLNTIQSIRARRTYKDISKDYSWDKLNETTKLDSGVVRIICQMLHDGKSRNFISEILKIPYHVIGYIERRQNYTDISKDYTW